MERNTHMKTAKPIRINDDKNTRARFYEKLILVQPEILNPVKRTRITIRAKINNQELSIRKQSQSDVASKCLDFQNI